MRRSDDSLGTARSLGKSPPASAALGNWLDELEAGLSDAGPTDEIGRFLVRDDNYAFMRFPPEW